LESSDNQVQIISVTSTEILLLQSISIPSDAVYVVSVALITAFQLHQVIDTLLHATNLAAVFL
jgi:hypothetical protein